MSAPSYASCSWEPDQPAPLAAARSAPRLPNKAFCPRPALFMGRKGDRACGLSVPRTFYISFCLYRMFDFLSLQFLDSLDSNGPSNF